MTMNIKKGKSGEEIYVIAKYDYTAQGSQELDLKKNEKLTLLDDSKNWWKVLNAKNQSGFVPSNYVKKEKPSIFDSIRKKVRKRSESKSSISSPVSSPIATRIVDIDISGSSTSGGGIGCNLNRSPEMEAQLRANQATSSSSHGQTSSQSIAVVKYNYEAQQSDELSLVKGTRIHVLEKSSDGWWKGEIDNTLGWFPSNYVIEEPLPVSSIKEMKPEVTLNGTGGGGGGGGGGGVVNKISDIDAPGCSMVNKVDNGLNRIQNEPEFEVVIALYSFTSQNEEELSFQRGERLEIIDKPSNDPDWWMARNASGDTGLVPKNYVQLISDKQETTNNVSSNNQIVSGVAKDLAKLLLSETAKSTGPLTGIGGNGNSYRNGGAHNDLQSRPWYFGSISRSNCDQMLNEGGIDGDFLIRDSETNYGDFSVSLKAPGRNKHFRVHFENGVYCIGQRRFNSLDELIEHYKKAPIYTTPKGQKMYLIKPFSPMI
ncbi:cytoplasmic protein NCK2-like [Panonychus citri]|uniref:cytoplasmic protein NCK2-like n=1 Tax=Panonychus citri TaxID=50023 RepID=UPI002307EF6E|nr:cytoplasmic protein NCK2-like [Panonychus citri]